MHHFEGDISLWGGVKYYAATSSYLVPSVMIALCLALAPLFYKHARHRHVVAIWLLFPVVLHIVLKLRHYRYLFPLVPAVAVIVAVGLVSLRPRLRGAATAATAMVLLFLFIACQFNGETCDRIKLSMLSPYYDLVDNRRRSLASFLLGCGDAMFTAPKCAPDVHAGDAKVGDRVARWIAGKQPKDATAVLYYGVVETNVALAARRNLPRLRLSEYVFGDYPHYQAPATWHRYSLFEFRGVAPDFTRGLRRDEFLLLKKPASQGQPGGASRLVLWKLRPKEVWPRPTRDEMVRYIEQPHP